MPLKQAFTLLEIIVVLVVISIMATFIGSRLTEQKPEEELPNILNEFNNLASFARQEAMSDRKNYRLFLKSEQKGQDFVVVESEESDPENPGKKIYRETFSGYFDTKYLLPESVKMKAVYKNKREEEFEENMGKAYCYVVPDGLVEDCMVHIVRTIEFEKKEIKATFKVEPFKGEFEFHEGFLRPGT